MRRQAVLFFALLSALPAASRAQQTQSVFPARSALITGAVDTSASVATDSTAAQAIQLSDAYYTRLTIHRYASYTELPLFAAEYYLGNKLINGTSNTSVRSVHKAVAYGLAGLFTVNTVTGVWNLVESRHVAEGRTSRLLHAGLMLAADAGFAYTGSLAKRAHTGSQSDKTNHRNAALVSIGLATSGTLVMWLR
jgi:hypothetical protein